MINTSSEPMLVNPEIGAKQLDVAIRKAISYTIKNEAEHYGSTDGSPVFRVYSRQATFAFFMVEELNGNHSYTEEFIHAAFALTKIPFVSKAKHPLDMKSLLLARPNTNIKGLPLTLFRGGLKTVLFHLWHQRVIMLPLVFLAERSIRQSALKELLSEVAALFWNYDRSKVLKPQNHPIMGSWGDGDFEKAHRIIWATDWHSFENVTLDEMSDFHLAIVTGKGTPAVPNTTWPFATMLVEMLNQHESKMRFTWDQVRLYRQWIRRNHNYQNYSFNEFLQNLPSIKRARIKQYSTRKVEAGKKKDALRRERLAALTGLDFCKPPLHTLLEQSASKNDHEAALNYFSQLPGLKRRYDSIDRYPGRLHVDVATLGTCWLKTFDGWLKFRDRQGYEENGNARASIRVLWGYLFLYLPWWAELYPQNRVEFPASPADFTRFAFVAPNGKSFEESPVPLLEILKQRRRTICTQGAFISDLSFYFDYLIGNQNMYPELDGRVLTNPIILKLDFPKGRKRNSKTNKVPFPKKIFPYVLRYFYAVEKFGIHLQELVLQGKLTCIVNHQPETFVPEDYGPPVQLEFNGHVHHIREIPNVFSIVKRTIRNFNGDLLAVYVPHLTALRILIVGLETGLRIQSVQWLDRRNWDSRNVNKPPDQYVYDLFVNTDKTKERPWIAPLVFRARDVLLREQHFQQSMVEEQMEELIPYENRTNSRFADVLPLFRTSGYKPTNDGWYHFIWLELLKGFQKFYNEEVSIESFTQFIQIKPGWINGVEAEGNERIDYDDSGIPHCPVRLVPINTPHSARASFCSNRSGILAVEDIARAVGHNNELVTYHYMVEEYDQLVEKIKEADQQLFNYDQGDPVHVRADQVNSALRRGVRDNPDEAEKRFGFISVSLLNENKDDIADGVALLRTTSMSQAVFRETHICPVGETCPDSIRDLIQEPRRCGLCPLAVKSVDHLPAIAAKMSQLLECAQNASQQLEKLGARGEPLPVLEEINERRKLDIYEYLGWKRALQILSDTLEKMSDDDTTVYHVDEPEVVKRHLQLVCKQTNKVEFIISRIADANAYPIMETPELRTEASRLRQRLLTNLGQIEEAQKEIPAGDEVVAFLSSMRAAMEALGISRQDLLHSNLLENRTNALNAARPVRLLHSGIALTGNEPGINPQIESL